MYGSEAASHSLGSCGLLDYKDGLQVTVKKSRFITGTGAAKCTFTDVKPTHSDGSMVALDKDGKLMMFNLDSGDSKVIFTKVCLSELGSESTVWTAAKTIF